MRQPCFEYTWFLNGMKMQRFSVCYIFLFRTSGKKGHLDENEFHTVMVVFPRAPFWKFLDRSFVQSSFSTIIRHIDNSILKDTLQLKILRTWIKIGSRSNSFIKTWVNMMKHKPTKVPIELKVSQKFESALQRTLLQNRWHLTYFYTLLFVSNKPSF